jgi:hypothetical protein
MRTQKLLDSSCGNHGRVFTIPPCLRMPLAADIYIQSADLLPFERWLPIDGGNRTIVLAGARPDGGRTIADWGGQVAIMHHPAEHAFYAYNLVLQVLCSLSECWSQAAKQLGGMFVQ